MDAQPTSVGGWRCSAAAIHAGAPFRLLAGLLCGAVVGLCATTAHATPNGRAFLGQAIAQADAAEFRRALVAFARAERSQDLTRDDLVRLYGYRAVVRFAVGDRDEMEADLACLLALDPHAELPASAPPPVHRVFERLARLGVSPPRLVIDPSDLPDGVQIHAHTEGGPPDLVQHVRIFARTTPDPEWTGAEDRLALVARRGAGVEWYVEAIGPGGAVVDSEGSADEPQRLRVGRASAPEGGVSTAVFGPPGRAVDDGSDAHARRKWWWIGTGTTLAVGAAVLATALVLSNRSNHSPTTRVAAPALTP